MAEFNQCQSMLKQLYAELPLEGDTMVTAAAEFAAYRVLYALAHSAQQLGEELRALAHSRHGWLQHRFVRHALQVPALPQDRSCRIARAVSPASRLHVSTENYCGHRMRPVAPNALRVRECDGQLQAIAARLSNGACCAGCRRRSKQQLCRFLRTVFGCPAHDAIPDGRGCHPREVTAAWHKPTHSKVSAPCESIREHDAWLLTLCRSRGLAAIAQAFMPSVPLDFVAFNLGLDSGLKARDAFHITYK